MKDKEPVIASCNQVIETKIDKLPRFSWHGDGPSFGFKARANHLEVSIFTRLSQPSENYDIRRIKPFSFKISLALAVTPPILNSLF